MEVKQRRDFSLGKFNLEALAGSVARWTHARAWTSWLGGSQKCTDQPLDYIITGSLPNSSSSSLLFFFILTLIECREIKKTLHYSGEPALHVVVLAAMNCPSGPFRSEFLITNSFSLCARLQPGHGEEAQLVIVNQSDVFSHAL